MSGAIIEHHATGAALEGHDHLADIEAHRETLVAQGDTAVRRRVEELLANANEATPELPELGRLATAVRPR